MNESLFLIKLETLKKSITNLVQIMLIARILKIQKVGEERENRNKNKKLLKNILKVHVATDLHPFPLKKLL